MSARFRWTLTNIGDSTSEVLTRDPIGWDDLTLKLSRDKLYHGVFTEFSLSLKWHCEGGGKTFIDNVYATEDVNGIIEVLIEIDCDGTGTYTDFYTGRLNLASYSTDGEVTSCNIEKSDLFSKLKARDDIEVNLETTTSIGQETITAIAPIQLELHSQNLFLRSKMERNAFSSSITFPVVETATCSGYVSQHLNVIETEAENFTGWDEFSDVTFGLHYIDETFITEVFEATDEKVSYPATYVYRTQFSGIFNDSLFNDVGAPTAHFRGTSQVLFIRYGATLPSATAITLLSTGTHTYDDASHDHPFDTTALSGSITLNFGDKIWIAWKVITTLANTPVEILDNTYTWNYDIANFSIEINSTTATSETKAVFLHEAWNQVADAIADKDVSFYSDFYGRMGSQKVGYNSNGCGAMIVVTNGINIRQHDENILCSLKDLFTAFNALHNIGLTIEPYDGVYTPEQDVIRVEKLSYFYDNTTQLLNLTRPVKVDVSNDNTRYVNDITIGYDKWETEIMGGLDEPNTKHDYSTKVNSIKGVYKKLAPYIASGYGIEITRRKSVEGTTDWKYDNDNFIIALVNTIRADFIDSGGGDDDLIIFYNINSFPYSVGETFTIAGSASNDGIYTVVSGEISVNDYVVTVAESVVAETNQTITIDGFYRTEQYVDSFSSGSGMTALDTAYNLRFTPARMLLAHMNAITACIQIIQGLVSFVKGEGNTTLAVSKNDVGCQEDYSEEILSESQSFNWNDSDVANIVPLWLPEIYKFDYPLSASQLSAIRANPHGYISVTDDHGNIRNGFILDVEFNLKTGKTKFELLKMFE